MFSRVPIPYKNTRGSLGELEIAWKHSCYVLVFSLQFLVLPKLPLVFLLLYENMENVCYFLNSNHINSTV